MIIEIFVDSSLVIVSFKEVTFGKLLQLVNKVHNILSFYPFLKTLLATGQNAV